MRGFFAGSELHSKPPPSLLPKCGACGLYKTCKSPKMRPDGSGRRRVLLVGEAPGANEDEEGVPFIGKAGRFLEDTLFDLGVDMREDCWITNALICRPPDNKIPSPKVVQYCQPNLFRTVEELKPDVVVLIGSTAVASFIGRAYKQNPGALSRWVGWRIPNQNPRVWVCPTYHPSYLQRSHNDLLNRAFKRHLQRAFALCSQGAPWKDGLPDYESRVECIQDPTEAAKVIEKMRVRGGAFGYDIENNCLLPETPKGMVVSASLCWRGLRTIAYPWLGEAVEATRRILHDEHCHFIATNMKHEDRWARRAFGRGVRNWLWDPMLAAHVLDNRPGICSLKFQAYVRLGADAYDEHLGQYLEGRGATGLNRILSEIAMPTLLTYNGVDSLLAYLAAEDQMREMGIDPLLTTKINASAPYPS